MELNLSGIPYSSQEVKHFEQKMPVLKNRLQYFPTKTFCWKLLYPQVLGLEVP